ncbi:ThuA domain-containing protein [Saccharopolyspora cebuensis]|uniref:ThuA domain-containing protein n=1 Tax=Saccharopolyspora cebuensis TaxID=418759 RepID=A0ABV4CQL6_9PSEU
MNQQQLRVTVWNEGVHEALNDPPGMAEYYPRGIHGALAEALHEQLPGATVRTALLDDPGHGLDEEVLAATDVLLWWGHKAHDRVADEVVDRVQRHVLGGMGLLVLHSGHFSKVFTRLMGTTCSLFWRNNAERELVWTVDPTHPIAEGVPNPIIIPEQETYGEHFDIPAPDELVFISGFSGGEVFRSGATFHRGKGRIFYFSPGDERYPVYHHPEVRRVLGNGVRWAARPGVPREQPRVANAPQDWFA